MALDIAVMLIKPNINIYQLYLLHAVIEFEIKDDEDIIYADEGDMSVRVCVHVTCVEGPTKRGAPILFIVPSVPGKPIHNLIPS